MSTGHTFQYFTYFLNPLKQGALFTEKRDKNDLFKDLLKKGEIEYESYGVKYAFVLVAQKDGYFIGKLGKQASIKRNLPPEQEFKETHEESWPFCWIIINTNQENGRGQKIAFEYKSYIFNSPHEQLKHFEDELNISLFSLGYALSINPITQEQEFWKIIDQHKDHIESLTFSFNVPNLFDLKTSLSEELKGLQKEYGSTKIALELENPDGRLFVPKNKLMEEGIDYISRGGGEYFLKIKGRKKKVIKSKNNIETKTFDDLELVISGGKQEPLFDILGKIFE